MTATMYMKLSIGWSTTDRSTTDRSTIGRPEHLVPLVSLVPLGVVDSIAHTIDMTDRRTYAQMVEWNGFLSVDERDQLRAIHVKINRTRWAIRRFVGRWKWYRAKQFDVECDLESTSLLDFPRSETIELLEDGTRYRFRITDLIRVIDSAVLSLDDEMFANPLPIRNPYTNIQFSIANLYNIYFHIHASRRTVPLIIRLLFTQEFDVEHMVERYEATVRDLAIRSYTANMTSEMKLFYIEGMLDTYNTDPIMWIRIDKRFPDIQRIRTFEPFLEKYLLSVFGFNPDMTQRYFAETGVRIFRFKATHPRYGRRVRIMEFRFDRSIVQSEEAIDEIADGTAGGTATGWKFLLK
jgi:hypothetical protein